MAIKGKKQYSVYLDEEDAEYVKSFLEQTRNKDGFSGLMNTYLKTMTRTLKAAGYKPGVKLTMKQVFKIGIQGIKQEVA